MIRKIIAYKDNFVEFYKSQDSKIQEKIEYVLDLVRFEKQVPKSFTSNWKTQTEFGRFVLLQPLRVFGFYVFKIKETLLY